MTPVVLFVGISKSGKTTLLEKVIAELKRRGYSVATIKHAPHSIDFDIPGKDSWRHFYAGSEATTLVSSSSIIFIKRMSEPVTLDDVIPLYGEDFDIILVEGFKGSAFPKIEVHRKAIGQVLSNIKNIIAYATDEVLEKRSKQFALDDVSGLADFIEKSYLKSIKKNGTGSRKQRKNA